MRYILFIILHGQSVDGLQDVVAIFHLLNALNAYVPLSKHCIHYTMVYGNPSHNGNPTIMNIQIPILVYLSCLGHLRQNGKTPYPCRSHHSIAGIYQLCGSLSPEKISKLMELQYHHETPIKQYQHVFGKPHGSAGQCSSSKLCLQKNHHSCGGPISPLNKHGGLQYHGYIHE